MPPPIGLKLPSGATPLPVYNASIAASRLPHMRVSAEVGCRDLNRRPPADLLLPTLTLKPREDSIRCQKQGYQ